MTASTTGLAAGHVHGERHRHGARGRGVARDDPGDADGRPRPRRPRWRVDARRRSRSAPRWAAPRRRRKTLDVTNTGGGTLSFTASDDAPWLSVAPAVGHRAADADGDRLARPGWPPGTYTGDGDGHRGRRDRLAEDGAGDVHGEPRAADRPRRRVRVRRGDRARRDRRVRAAATPARSRAPRGPRAARFGGALVVRRRQRPGDGAARRRRSPSRTAMTLEAWVTPTALGGWRTVLLKERAGGLSYALYASEDRGRPTVYGRAASERRRRPGAAALAARRLDAPRGHVRRHHAAPVRQRHAGGDARADGRARPRARRRSRSAATRVWGEWFKGRIDEVRVYNRALSAADIAGDMTPAVSGGA